MSNLLNLIPPIRRYRLHKIRVMLDPVYEAKSKDLDEFRRKLLKWSLEFLFSKDSLFFSLFCIVQLIFVLKIHMLFILIVPLIFIVSSILVSVSAYLSFRKELNLND